MKSIILRYGEINLKGKNRNYFEKHLFNSIYQKTDKYDVKVNKSRNRVVIDVTNENDVQILFDSFLKLPGIENVSIAQKCSNEYDDIKNLVLSVYDKTKPIFRISTKRINKKFELSSQEISKKMGGEILRANDGLEGMKVSMKEFEQEISIEILKEFTYVFHNKTSGLGGLPIGSSGKGIVLLSGGIDSPVAAIEAMKRGIKVSCAHFSTPPYTTKEALNKVKELVDILREYDSSIKLYDFNITAMQVLIKEKCTDRFTLLLMRRMMYRKASNFALSKKCKMIITGESIGQVASQTIESMTMTNMVSKVVVIRPLVTHNKNEIITRAKKYGTYETSIMPFEDACTVFAPKKPETRPELKDILIEEEKIDVEQLVRDIEFIEVKQEEELINDYL